MKWLKFLAVLAMLALAVSVTPEVARADRPEKIDPEKHTVGAKMAQGKKIAKGCEFPQLSFESKEGVWASYKANNSCELILDARWKGKATDAPSNLQALLTASEDGGSSSGDDIPDTVDSFCTLHKHMVYTFGGGGPDFDRLTRLTGWITTCSQPPYNGFSSATHGRRCWGATWPATWDWVRDVCKKYGLTVTLDRAYATQQGNFHCQPTGDPNPCALSDPDGYYHNLYLTEDIYWDGPSYCLYYISGQWVLGPNG